MLFTPGNITYQKPTFKPRWRPSCWKGTLRSSKQSAFHLGTCHWSWWEPGRQQNFFFICFNNLLSDFAVDRVQSVSNPPSLFLSCQWAPGTGTVIIREYVLITGRNKAGEASINERRKAVRSASSVECAHAGNTSFSRWSCIASARASSAFHALQFRLSSDIELQLIIQSSWSRFRRRR